MFGNLGAKLREQNVPPDAVRAYLFGGCAVHLHTRARSSDDVDAEFDYDLIYKNELLLAKASVPLIDYEDPDSGPMQLMLDSTFNPTFGPCTRITRIGRGNSMITRRPYCKCGFRAPKI